MALGNPVYQHCAPKEQKTYTNRRIDKKQPHRELSPHNQIISQLSHTTSDDKQKPAFWYWITGT
jgi:hypothetical protein